MSRVVEPALFDLLRRTFLEKRCGTLIVEVEEGSRRMQFDGGDLFLPSDHPLAQRLADLLELETRLGPSNADAEAAGTFVSQARTEVEALASRLVDVLCRWSNGSPRFLDRPIDRSRFVGPFPTAFLVMEAGLRGLSTSAMWSELGGQRQTLVAALRGDEIASAPHILPQEMFLLSRAERGLSILELIAQSGRAEEEALRDVCRLFFVGLLIPDATAPGAGESQSEDESDAWMASLEESFERRIGRSLELDPELPARARHRQAIERLAEAVCQQANHYEVLELAEHDLEETVHQAYEELARLTHPRQASRFAGELGEIDLTQLFRRATRAYITLNDPERRAAYNRELRQQDDRARRLGPSARQSRAAALSHYERALEAIRAGDYHSATELLERAVADDPQAEYLAALAGVQQRNPHWLTEARSNYRKALTLDPRRTEWRLELATLEERAGSPEEAMELYADIKTGDPEFQRAHAEVDRIRRRQAVISVSPTGEIRGAASASSGLPDWLQKVGSLFRKN